MMFKYIAELTNYQYNAGKQSKEANLMQIKFKKFATSLTSLLLAGLVVCLSAFTSPAYADVSQPVPQAQVSFTFDDGTLDALTLAAPTLQKYGITGTDYVISGCVGTTGTCNADPNAAYMDWDQISQLNSQYGWEIGGHSNTHPLMTEISDAQIEQEVATSKQQLAAHGYDAKAFATPFGDYNSKVEAAVSKYYTSHRGFHDIGYNGWPYTPHLLYVQQVQAGVSVETVKSYIDTAKANNYWLILVFHVISDNASNDPEDYQYSTSDLDEIAAYVKAQNIKTTNITAGLVAGSNNLLPINTDLQSGWTTDAPSAVTADTNNHGSAPEPADSLQVVAQTTQDVHLFSPQVTVSPTDTYVINGYLNIVGEGEQTGSISAYVDEYDANGNWISGQLKQTITNAAFKDLSFAYTATSNTVVKASLQIIAAINSGITAFLDNLGWFTTKVVATAKPGDVNGDGLINIKDATIVSLNWGKTGATKAQGDLNGDGTVGIKDATIISLNWSK